MIRLRNKTDLEAYCFWGAAPGQRLGCVVLIKGTFELGEGQPRLTGSSPWPVHLEELETPYGVFPGEVAHRKHRLDVIVLGKAHAPGGQAVRRMEVTVQVDDFLHTISVFGDRRWQRDGDGWAPGEPAPFTELPLLYDNAYGGSWDNEWGTLVCPQNPAGKGFCMDHDEAEGLALPNLEDPKDLISDPGDRPRPVGLAPYPMTGGLRLSRFGRMGPDGPEPNTDEEVKPLISCWAHPDLMLDRESTYRRVRATGVQPDGAIDTPIPVLPASVALSHGPDVVPLEPILDTLILQCEERRLTLRWRAGTAIPLRAREKRQVILEPASGGS